MGKTWTTSLGVEIRYKDLNDDHLANIVQMGVDRLAMLYLRNLEPEYDGARDFVRQIVLKKFRPAFREAHRRHLKQQGRAAQTDRPSPSEWMDPPAGFRGSAMRRTGFVSPATMMPERMSPTEIPNGGERED